MDIREKCVVMLENDIKLNLKEEDCMFVERKLMRKYGNIAKGVYSNLSSLYLLINLFNDMSDKDFEILIEKNKKKFKTLYSFVQLTPNGIRELRKRGSRSMAEVYLDIKKEAKIDLWKNGIMPFF